MSQIFEGNLDGRGLKVGIVASRFNGFIVEHLLRGAREGLRKCGVAEGSVDIAHVPGALELAFAAGAMADSGKYDAVICIGCIIRGATNHFDLVCAETAKGVSQVSAATGVPAIFAVVTSDTIEQAIERSGAKAGNKGYDGALAAVEMATLIKKISKKRRTRK